MPKIKFRLFAMSTVRMQYRESGGLHIGRFHRDEPRYHYESEDKQIRVIFNLAEDEKSWEIIGSASRPLAMKLIEAHCNAAMDATLDNVPVMDRIQEIEIEV